MPGADRELDLERLGDYLAAHLREISGPMTAHQFATGQSNPTYRLDTSGETYVLRCKPLGKLLKSAHAVDREFRVQKALAGTDVPVPRMLLLCEDDSIIGSAFYLMSYVAGRNFADPQMDGESNATRAGVIDDMGRVLAALHCVDVAAVGLADFGPPGNYFDRQVGRWSQQYRATMTQTLPDMDRLMDLLAERIPPEDGQRTLVHGDFRIDNLIFDADAPVCRAVLDWELSTVGHPFADLASVIMQWQLPPGRDGRGLMGVGRAALGLPSDAEFVAAYCDRRGLKGIENFGFYLAFCFFRMAAILQGVLKRAQDGNASNPDQARKLGAYVPVLAAAGLRAAEG
ncbi:MAG: phosphotransferase family protein [Marinibacterium sp.]